MGARKKQVVQKIKPGVDKQPKNIEKPESYLNKRPVWAFGRCDRNHDRWTIGSSPDFYNEILHKLVSFEGQSWSEIKIRDKKKNHYIPMSELCTEAQKRAETIHLHEDELFSLRLDGTLRLFGVIDDGIFNIIWYDSNHYICPSHLKHT